MSLALGLVLSAAVGILVVRAISADLPPGVLIGSGILVGLAVPPFVLSMLGLFGIGWRPILAVAIVMLIGASAYAIRMKRPSLRDAVQAQRQTLIATLLDGCTAIVLSGYAVFALSGPPAETDFVTIWGLKGLRFFHAAGFDFEFLKKGWNSFSHPDYPLLLPLIYDWLALLQGGWTDRWFGAVFVLFGLGAVLVVRSVLEEDLGSPAAAAAGALALVPFAVAPYMGMAEGPLIAYATAGVLLVRRGLVRGLDSNVLLGAVLLGLGASTKNEGLTLVACMFFAAAVVAGFRGLAGLWPAAVLPLPWLITRQIQALSTDLAASGALSRLVDRLADPAEVLLAISRTPFGKPLFWIGIALALAVGGRSMVRREKLVLATIALQYLFYLGAYFVTPHDVQWHVTWSWERIVNQMTMLLGFVAVSSVLASLLRRETDGLPAQAGHSLP